MKTRTLLPRLATGVVLGLAASTVSALTIGRAQGAALIGRPLEISVPVMLDYGAENLSQCSQAEVFYGDSRVDAARVIVDAPSGGPALSVRVRATPPVNEPVVTVYLHLGCGSKVTRRMVLLAEQPDPAADVGRPAPRTAQSSPTVDVSGGVVRDPMAPAAPAQRGRADRIAAAAATLKPTPRDAPTALASPLRSHDTAPERRDAAASRTQAAAPARLKLEPADLASGPNPHLRMSGLLPAGQVASSEQRVQAAALWRALNARPEDVLRDSQRLESLEKEIAAFRQSMQRNDAAVAGLRSEMQTSQSRSNTTALMFGVAALVLSACAVAYAWRRSGPRGTDAADWWRSRDGRESELLSVPAAATTPTPPGSGSAGVLEVDSGPVDLDLNFADSLLRGVQQPSPPHGSFAPTGAQRVDDFQPSQTASMRAVRAEELHDVQQEADFFMSLGDPDRAIEVLRNHIAMNPTTSAVAWLDLLEIHHKLQRREDYDEVRREFIRNFSVQVPEFDAYRESRAGLEDYGNAMTRITSLWPSRKVLDLIEESIFRKPGQAGAEAFSLEAYRDLLLLHQIGRDATPVVQFADSIGAAGTGFLQTSLHPLQAHAGGDSVQGTRVPDVDAGLDINLDEPVLMSEPLIGVSEPASSGDGNLVDFDLPPIDTTKMRPKKTRE